MTVVIWLIQDEFRQCNEGKPLLHCTRVETDHSERCGEYVDEEIKDSAKRHLIELHFLLVILFCDAGFEEICPRLTSYLSYLKMDNMQFVDTQ